jgi:hypothetical protein
MWQVGKFVGLYKNFLSDSFIFEITMVFLCTQYLDEHILNFCLADVRVNGELLVNRIFEQTGRECFSFLCLFLHLMSPPIITDVTADVLCPPCFYS